MAAVAHLEIFDQRRFAVLTRALANILCVLLHIVSADAEKADLRSVPFVGCAGDGQVGPISAPASAGVHPMVPAADAPRLAYYAFPSAGVLAPRNWHCFALYGSGGVTLFVAPTPLRKDMLDYQNPRLRGSAVVVSRVLGDTSGRFQAAEVAARIFPAARQFVLDVIAEGIASNEHFHFAPYPADLLRRRSATEVEFVTPGGHAGLGTWAGLTADNQPIVGAAIWRPDDDPRLIMLDVRLPPEMRGLSKTIIGQTEASQGDPKIEWSPSSGGGANGSVRPR